MQFLQRILKIPLKVGNLTQSSASQFCKPTNIKNTRTFFIVRRGPPKIEYAEKKFKIKDKMPSTAILVYNNPFSYWIEPFFHLQNIFSISYLAYTIYFIKRYLNNEIKMPAFLNGYMIFRDETEICLFFGVTSFILILSFFACKFTTFRIYFNESEKVYKGIFVGYLPFLRKTVTINPNSVSAVIRRFPNKDYRTFEFKVDGKKIFLFEDYFRKPSDFHKMLETIH